MLSKHHEMDVDQATNTEADGLPIGGNHHAASKEVYHKCYYDYY